MNKNFDCTDCGTNIPGTNCAYTLSRSNNWKKVPGCYYHCHCGYPVRAKEVRDNIYGSKIDGDRNSNENAYIYCEKNGGGHIYYGTYNTCVQGNGYTAQSMNPDVFSRYRLK